MASKMTPTQEAEYALAYGSRDDLNAAAQAEYDRLRIEGIPATPAEPGIPERSTPEVRAAILGMFKRANSKYRKPFESDRLAAASLVGTESWAEYGQVVLQMAMLDTLLSIEEKLGALLEEGK
jgi:hypothetical protein